MKLIISFVILLLAGCSTTQTMQNIMSSWEGAHIDDVVAQWGYPNFERDFRGKKLYIWEYRKSGFIPKTSQTNVNVYGNTAYANTQEYGGYAISGVCTRILEVGDDGIVKSWSYEGNNCPFGELMEYSTWRRK